MFSQELSDYFWVWFRRYQFKNNKFKRAGLLANIMRILPNYLGKQVNLNFIAKCSVTEMQVSRQSNWIRTLDLRSDWLHERDTAICQDRKLRSTCIGLSLLVWKEQQSQKCFCGREQFCPYLLFQLNFTAQIKIVSWEIKLFNIHPIFWLIERSIIDLFLNTPDFCTSVKCKNKCDYLNCDQTTSLSRD